MSARVPITMALVMGSISKKDADELVDEYRAEVLTEAANDLDSIAAQIEARVAEHYGAASGIGPGSADMVRESARTVRAMAGGKASSPEPTATQTADFFQPGHTYERGRWQFLCLAVAPAPWNGEVRAVGYLLRSGDEGSVWHLNTEDWARGDWTEATGTEGGATDV